MLSRILLVVFIVLAAALQYRLWLSPQGMPEVARLERALAAQRIENASLGERNTRLEAEVEDLRQGLDAVEERARTELGMVGRNESFFQVVESEPARAEPHE
jgi:cell division protein FtsB